MDHKVTRCKCGSWKMVDAACSVCAKERKVQALNRLTHVLLVAALTVGLSFATHAEAQAPHVTEKQKISLLSPKEYAERLVMKRWNSQKQFQCLKALWGKESAWNHKAANPVSTAFGIPQFLNQTWINYGYPVRPKSAHTQVEAGLKYIKARYKTPCGAWAFWLKQAGPDKRGGWY